MIPPAPRTSGSARCGRSASDAANQPSVPPSWEAAHISPYSGPSSDHVGNGLLLRADIPTLFDCGLLAFDPETRQVVLADRLRGSDYAHLASQALREPSDPTHRPNPLCLAQRLGTIKE
jgi:HNH endonuclease